METKKILIVDDDADMVLATRLVLESAGYDVQEAVNGETALERMRTDKPDLVLMDVMMANPLDGYHTTQQIAYDPEISHIPILMVSAITASEHAANFPTDQLVSIREFIPKPIEPEKLLKKIQRYVR